VVYAPESGQKQNQLCAEVFVYESFREEMGDEEALAQLRADMAAINKRLPAYKQVHNVSLRDTMFEKTTKNSIKRFS